MKKQISLSKKSEHQQMKGVSLKTLILNSFLQDSHFLLLWLNPITGLVQCAAGEAFKIEFQEKWITDEMKEEAVRAASDFAQKHPEQDSRIRSTLLNCDYSRSPKSLSITPMQKHKEMDESVKGNGPQESGDIKSQNDNSRSQVARTPSYESVRTRPNPNIPSSSKRRMRKSCNFANERDHFDDLFWASSRKRRSEAVDLSSTFGEVNDDFLARESSENETLGDADDDWSCIGISERHDYTSLRIDHDEEVDNFLKTRFHQLSQLVCKIIAKAWIKVILPKKQVHWPYNRGDSTKPSWWPEGVRHKEPDHLMKDERTILLMKCLEEAQTSMSRLRKFQEATNECELSSDKKRLVDEIYKVVATRERFKTGELGPNCSIYVHSASTKPNKQPSVAPTNKKMKMTNSAQDDNASAEIFLSPGTNNEERSPSTVTSTSNIDPKLQPPSNMRESALENDQILMKKSKHPINQEMNSSNKLHESSKRNSIVQFCQSRSNSMPTVPTLAVPINFGDQYPDHLHRNQNFFHHNGESQNTSTENVISHHCSNINGMQQFATTRDENITLFNFGMRPIESSQVLGSLYSPFSSETSISPGALPIVSQHEEHISSLSAPSSATATHFPFRSPPPPPPLQIDSHNRNQGIMGLVQNWRLYDNASVPRIAQGSRNTSLPQSQVSYTDSLGRSLLALEQPPVQSSERPRENQHAVDEIYY